MYVYVTHTGFFQHTSFKRRANFMDDRLHSRSLVMNLAILGASKEFWTVFPRYSLAICRRRWCFRLPDRSEARFAGVAAARSLELVFISIPVPEAPEGCAGPELQPKSSKIVFQHRLRVVVAHYVAGSFFRRRQRRFYFSQDGIVLSSPRHRSALLQGTYFYPCRVSAPPWSRIAERQLGVGPWKRRRFYLRHHCRIRTRMWDNRPISCSVWLYPG